MVRIRPADPADLDRLREIQAAALAEPWPELLDTAVDGPLPVLVAEDDRPVGYAIVVSGEGRVYVPELAVDPARQREGHGSALLAALCEHLRAEGHDALRLTVQATDDEARSFYREHDFEVVERVEDHFESGDGLVLERPLDPE